jgi:hypothetical protein
MNADKTTLSYPRLSAFICGSFWLAAVILLPTAPASGQAAPAPAFDVASIKPSAADPPSGSGVTTGELNRA